MKVVQPGRFRAYLRRRFRITAEQITSLNLGMPRTCLNCGAHGALEEGDVVLEFSEIIAPRNGEGNVLISFYAECTECAFRVCVSDKEAGQHVIPQTANPSRTISQTTTPQAASAAA